MPGENEVKIGETKIGPSTIIQLNLKFLFTLLSFLLSTAYGGYKLLDNSIKDLKKSNQEEITNLSKEIQSLKDQDLRVLSNRVHQVDGKVEGIFLIVNAGNNRESLNPTRQMVNITPPPPMP
jgi:hypothetical protein